MAGEAARCRKKLPARFVPAWQPLRSVMAWIGIAGLPVPWSVCYVLPAYKDHRLLIAHELVHFEQMQRDGAVLWTLKWVWWTLRYGYRRNPYEREAYRRQYEGFMIPLEDIIEDADTRAHAAQQFKDVDPNWDGHVTAAWIKRSYYGEIRAWCLKAGAASYLVSPLACTPPFQQGPAL